MVLKTEPRALHILGKHCTTELYPQPSDTFILRQGLVKLPKLALNL